MCWLIGLWPVLSGRSFGFPMTCNDSRSICVGHKRQISWIPTQIERWRRRRQTKGRKTGKTEHGNRWQETSGREKIDRYTHQHQHIRTVSSLLSSCIFSCACCLSPSACLHRSRSASNWSKSGRERRGFPPFSPASISPGVSVQSAQFQRPQRYHTIGRTNTGSNSPCHSVATPQ